MAVLIEQEKEQGLNFVEQTEPALASSTHSVRPYKQLKVRVWKKFKLEDTKEALQSLFAKERDGRILLDVDSSI